MDGSGAHVHKSPCLFHYKGTRIRKLGTFPFIKIRDLEKSFNGFVKRRYIDKLNIRKKLGWNAFNLLSVSFRQDYSHCPLICGT